MPITKNFRLNDYLTEEDFKEFIRLVKRRKEGEAIARYCSKLPRHISADYARQMVSVINESARRIYSEGELKKLEKQISIQTFQVSGILCKGYNEFIAKAIAPSIFKDNLITASKVKEALYKSTVSEYEGLIRGAMSGTEANVLNTIRTWQRDLIQRQQAFRLNKNPELMIEIEKQNFTEYIRQRHPGEFEAIQQGKILRSRPLKDGKYKYFDLEEYSEMSVTKTIQNLEANTVETGALIFGVPVVEYYLRDKRKTSNERDICTHILKNTLNGKALLALDSKTAKILGIMELYKARQQGAMGFGCRHNIKQLDSQFRKEIEKALYLKGLKFEKAG